MTSIPPAGSGFSGSVEFAPGFAPRPGITHALFDFDGTLSLIREGWPDIMVPMFVEMLPALPGETDADRRRLCLDDIMRLNGKQTIYQMIQLADRAASDAGFVATLNGGHVAVGDDRSGWSPRRRHTGFELDHTRLGGLPRSVSFCASLPHFLRTTNGGTNWSAVSSGIRRGYSNARSRIVVHMRGA